VSANGGIDSPGASAFYEVVTDPFALREIVGGYIEAQIHGGVTLDDIEAVRFSVYTDVNPVEARYKEQLFKNLQEKGIPFEYHDGGYDYEEGVSYQPGIRLVPSMEGADEHLDYLKDTYGMKIIRRPGE